MLSFIFMTACSTLPANKQDSVLLGRLDDSELAGSFALVLHRPNMQEGYDYYFTLTYSGLSDVTLNGCTLIIDNQKFILSQTNKRLFNQKSFKLTFTDRATLTLSSLLVKRLSQGKYLSIVAVTSKKEVIMPLPTNMASLFVV
jgi:hypothetical protein